MEMNPVLVQEYFKLVRQCKSRYHSEVTIAHFLHYFIQNPVFDIIIILEQFNVDIQPIFKDLEIALYRIPPQKQQDDPVESKELSAAFKAAAQILSPDGRLKDLGYNFIRSGVILLAFLSDEEFLKQPYGSKLREKIDPEILATDFLYYTLESDENISDPDLSNHYREPGPLAKYCDDFATILRDEPSPLAVGRKNEIQLLVEATIAAHNRNSLLVGPPGVGKTAIVAGFTIKATANDAPKRLNNSKIWRLNLGKLILFDQTDDIGIKLLRVFNELKDRGKNNILFIDNVHLLLKGGVVSEVFQLEGLLVYAMTNLDICLIASTNKKQYDEMFEHDSVFLKRFNIITVAEPIADEVSIILRSHKSFYENKYNICIPESVIDHLVRHARRSSLKGTMPGIAVDLLEKCIMRMLANLNSPDALTMNVNSKIDQLNSIKNSLASDAKNGITTHKKYNLDMKLENLQAQKLEIEKKWELEEAIVAKIITLRNQLRKASTGENIDQKLLKLKELLKGLATIQGDDPYFHLELTPKIIQEVMPLKKGAKS